MALVRCNSFDEGARGRFTGALQIRVPNMRIFDTRMEQKSYKKQPKGSQQDAQGNQRELNRTQKGAKTEPKGDQTLSNKQYSEKGREKHART